MSKENKISNIAKNTSFFTFALILQKIITFTYFALLARGLDPSDLGKYYLAISWGSIFLTFVDLGQANVLTREVAKLSLQEEKLRINRLVGTVVAFKIPLAVLSVFSLVLLANLLGYPEITKSLIYMASIIMLLDTMSTSFFAIIRGFHNLKYESIASVLTQVIILLIGVYGLNQGYGVIYLMLVMVLGASFRFLYALFLMVFKWRLTLLPLFDYSKLKSFLLLTAPFALYGIFQKLYTYLDTVFLSKMAWGLLCGFVSSSF